MGAAQAAGSAKQDWGPGVGNEDSGFAQENLEEPEQRFRRPPSPHRRGGERKLFGRDDTEEGEEDELFQSSRPESPRGRERKLFARKDDAAAEDHFNSSGSHASHRSNQKDQRWVAGSPGARPGDRSSASPSDKKFDNKLLPQWFCRPECFTPDGGAAELVQAQCRNVLAECEEVEEDDPAGCLDENGEFQVVLNRKDGAPLGIDIIYWQQHTLLVEAILGGLVVDWNERNPRLAIRRGDVVVEVNGVRGDMHGLVNECTKNRMLLVTLRRPLQASPFATPVHPLR